MRGRFCAFLLVVPLLSAGAQAADAKVELARQTSNIQLLAADQKTPSAALFTQIIKDSLGILKAGDAGLDFQISVVADRALHLEPLLSRKVFDIGFAWEKPDCSRDDLSKSNKKLCGEFFFSNPIFEFVGRFYVKLQNNRKFNKISDLKGQRICFSQHPKRVADYDFTKIQLKSLPQCFQALMRDDVDAVMADEVNAAITMKHHGIGDQIAGLSQPAYRISYHGIIAKSHARARTYLYYLNSALSRLRSSGQHRQIVNRHHKHLIAAR